ncbi:hypothetical protein [Bacillus sp. 1P02SD]|uniref:hypothetical protein n=1 Tax=Bacillus sp. 1P02SD TaxID=3132264 RepID=UPI00399F4A41
MWHQCFREAWTSFQEGSRLIGAVVVNADGEIVARGKSAVFGELSDLVVFHNELAHAEIIALLKLDNRVHTKVNKLYALYNNGTMPSLFWCVIHEWE